MTTLKKYQYIIAIILELILVLGLNVLWEQASQFRLLTESINHSSSGLGIAYNHTTWRPYPYLFSVIASYFVCWLGANQWPFFVTQSFFLVIFVFSTYAAGAKLFNQKVGFLAATVLLFSAQAVTALRTFYIDYDLAALIMLQLTAYLYSRQFTKLWPSLLFGVLLPICVFGKYTYFIYLIPIIIAILYDLCRNRLPDTPTFFANWQNFALIFPAPIICGLAAFSMDYKPLHILFWVGLGELFALTYLYFRGEKCTLYRFLCYLTFFATWSLFWQFLTANFTEAEFNYNMVTYAQVNIDMSVDRTPMLLSWTDWLQIISIWLRGFLINLKIKLLLPVWFYLCSIGIFLSIFWTSLRRKTALLIIPLIFTSIFITYTTCNDTRYHAPMMGILAILATFWLVPMSSDNVGTNVSHRFGVYSCKLLRSLHFAWRKLAPIACWCAMLPIVIAGLALSGGWMTDLSIPATVYEYLHRDLASNNLCTVDSPLALKNQEVSRDGIEKRRAYVLNPSNRLETLYNFKSAWSDHLLFTILPEQTNWQEEYVKLLSFMHEDSSMFVDVEATHKISELVGSSGELVSALRLASYIEQIAKLRAMATQPKEQANKDPKQIMLTDVKADSTFPCSEDLASDKNLILGVCTPQSSFRPFNLKPEELSDPIYTWKTKDAIFTLYSCGQKK